MLSPTESCTAAGPGAFAPGRRDSARPHPGRRSSATARAPTRHRPMRCGPTRGLSVPFASACNALGHVPTVGGVARPKANLLAVAPAGVYLELRPLCSAGITRLPRSYGPLRHPIRPGLLLTEVQLMVTRHHRGGFPCCVGFPLARMPSSIPRQGHARVSLVTSRGGSLPRFHGGSAPALRVSRPARRSLHVTACWLAESLNDPFHRRLRPFRYLHGRFGCYRLERPVAGWELHPLKIHAFARRTRKPTVSQCTVVQARATWRKW